MAAKESLEVVLCEKRVSSKLQWKVDFCVYLNDMGVLFSNDRVVASNKKCVLIMQNYF